MKLELTDKEAAFLVKTLVQSYAEDIEDFVDPENMRATSIGQCIVEKLGDKSYSLYSKAHQGRYFDKPLNEKLFMGAGYHSQLLTNKLHRRLEFAFIQLSGIQQNGGMGTPFDTKYDEKATQDIIDVIKDLLTAFSISIEEII